MGYRGAERLILDQLSMLCKETRELMTTLALSPIRWRINEYKCIWRCHMLSRHCSIHGNKAWTWWGHAGINSLTGLRLWHFTGRYVICAMYIVYMSRYADCVLVYCGHLAWMAYIDAVWLILIGNNRDADFDRSIDYNCLEFCEVS